MTKQTMPLTLDKEKYYVYVILDSSNMSPIYVGKGKNNRAKWHIWASKFGYHYNKKLERKIRKLTSDFTNMDNISIQIDSVYDNEKDALDRECFMISEIGISNLCNLTGGGESPSLSESSIKKFVESRKSNGKPWHSEETKKRIGESRKGKLHSEETKRRFKQNHPKPMLGKNHTDETKKIMSENHAEFFGEKNPFYGKSHSNETKEYFRMKYGYEWLIIHNGVQTSVIGKSAIQEYVENYNQENNVSISYKTLLMYKKIKKHNIEIVQNGKWGK